MEKILRPKDTEKIVGLCDRQLRNLEAVGQFPKRFALSPEGRAKAHLESEVLRWIEERAATRETAE